ncbi:MAG: BrnA antitoxin family protein, partial [Candidatus Magasanikbacteria bacterium]|nr:BrnA antitoxin family protein [Candidatus Magasanikbacteria bacterium]
DAERDFWARVDLSSYFDTQDFEPVSFPNLKPTTRSVSIRMPEFLLVRLKEEANELQIPYQTLIKQKIAKELFQKDKKLK